MVYWYCVYFCSNGVLCAIVLLQAHHWSRVCSRNQTGVGRGVVRMDRMVEVDLVLYRPRW